MNLIPPKNEKAKNEHYSPNPWVVPENLLPVSKGASKELQNFQKSLKEKPNLPNALGKTPQTSEEWKQLQETTNAENAKAAVSFAKNHGISIQCEQYNGVDVYICEPATIKEEYENAVFYHIHGGAYLFGAGISCTQEAVKIACKLEIKVISVDYRMPIEHTYPFGLEDVIQAYQHLITNNGENKSIIMGGTSAGGGLTLAAIHRMIDKNIPLPSVLFAGTPWSDLTRTGDSYSTNECVDHVLVSYEGILRSAVDLYVPMVKDRKNKEVSPVYGNFENFPPLYLITGTRDLFLSDTVRIQSKMKAESSSDVELLVLEGIAHGDYLELHLPESELFFEDLNNFILKHIKEKKIAYELV